MIFVGGCSPRYICPYLYVLARKARVAAPVYMYALKLSVVLTVKMKLLGNLNVAQDHYDWQHRLKTHINYI